MTKRRLGKFFGPCDRLQIHAAAMQGMASHRSPRNHRGRTAAAPGSPGPGYSRERAMTLLELLVALVIVVTLAAIAVPAWRTAAAYGRGAAELNRLAADLAYARSAAIAHGRPVALCTSADGARCSDTPWDDGWIVYVDTDADLRRESGERLLRNEAAFASDDELTGNQLVAHRLGFRRDGLLLGLHNGTITFTPVPNRQALHRCLVIARTGRVRAAAGARCP